MAVDLTARFTLVDEMSDRLANMAQNAQRMADSLTRAGSSANGAFDTLESDLDRAGQAAEGAADAVTQMGNAAGDAAGEAEDLADALAAAGDAGEEACQGIAEVADSGDRLRQALISASDAAAALSSQMEQTSSIQDDLNSQMERASDIAERVAESDRVSAETQQKLSDAYSEAEAAQTALTEAQERAERAMQAYNTALDAGADNVEDLERAAREAADANADLEAAQRRAEDATRELSDAADEASDELEDTGQTGVDAFEALSGALASAGIASAIGEITSALMECCQVAAQTEVSFKQLQTIAGESSMPMLTQQIKDLSSATGEAQSDLAGVAYNAISAGSAVEDAVGTAESATKLAAAGFTDTASALSVLSTTMNSYGDAAGDAMEIADSLIMVQNLGVTTVSELAAAMGPAISTASAFNVSMGNLESAYISLTKAGINTAQSTTMISGLMSELGSSTSEAAMTLQETTGKSFGQLMASGMSLADVLGILYDSVGQNNEALMNLWGTQTAGLASAAIVNQGLETFNENLVTVTNSAGATESAYAIMSDTAVDAQEDMATAAQNLQIAIGDALNPTLSKLYGLGTQAFSWAADFAAEHPVVIKALTALGVGLGVAAVGLTGAAVAASGFGAAISGVLASLTPIIAPIAAVAAGVAALAGVFMIAVDACQEDLGAAEELTAQSREQYWALEDLTAEYEKAAEQYGENDERTLSLKYKVDQLTESFEANKETLAEVQAQAQELCSSVDELSSTYTDNMNQINKDETNTLALVNRLKELGNSTQHTSGDLEEMRVITSKLAETYPDLDINVYKVLQNTDELTESIKKQCEAEAEQRRLHESEETYIQALQKRAELTEQLQKAQENLNLEQERMDNMSGLEHLFTGSEYDDLEAYQAMVEELTAAMEENEATIADIEGRWEGISDVAGKAQEDTISAEEALSVAFEGVSGELEDLCFMYDQAYNAAMESFNGQFSLFDEAEANMEATVAAAQEAQNSQLAYWTSYNENIATLKELSAEDLGVTQENWAAMMEFVQAGSEEAAGLAASMVENVNSGNEEALATLANTIGEVEAQKQQAADSVAEWQTDFNTKMDEIVQKVNQSVEDMDVAPAAEAAAKSTMDAYANQIKTSGGKAVAEAESIAKQIQAALNSANTTVKVNASVPGHALGTTNAEDVFVAGERGHELIVRNADAYATGTTESSDFYLAGEQGPELIVGQQGSTVFPTQETDRILNALTRQPVLEVPEQQPYPEPVIDIQVPQPQVISEPVINVPESKPQKMPEPVINVPEPAPIPEPAISIPEPAPLPEPVINLPEPAPTPETVVEIPEPAPIPEPVINLPEQEPIPEPVFDIPEPEPMALPEFDFPESEVSNITENYYQTMEQPSPILPETQESENTFPVLPPVEAANPAPAAPSGGGESSKRITLEINGSGAIAVDSSVDRESLLEVMQDNLRPVLMQIIQNEIYEEGQNSYDY